MKIKELLKKNNYPVQLVNKDINEYKHKVTNTIKQHQII